MTRELAEYKHRHLVKTVTVIRIYKNNVESFFLKRYKLCLRFGKECVGDPETLAVQRAAYSKCQGMVL